MGTRRVLKIAGLAAVILLCLFGLVGGGLSGGLLMLGLSALIIGLAAAIVGHARWAFIASRRVGGAAAGAGVVALLIGGVTSPPPLPTSSTSKAPASSSSTSSSASVYPTADEAAIQAVESTLALAETSETANSGASDITGLLSDQATTAAVDGAPPTSALAALAAVEVKGRAAKTGYSRGQFGAAWPTPTATAATPATTSSPAT